MGPELKFSVFGLSRTDKNFFWKKYSYSPPPFSLEKNKSVFFGCFSENHSNGSLTPKIEVQHFNMLVFSKIWFLAKGDFSHFSTVNSISRHYTSMNISPLCSNDYLFSVNSHFQDTLKILFRTNIQISSDKYMVDFCLFKVLNGIFCWKMAKIAFCQLTDFQEKGHKIHKNRLYYSNFVFLWPNMQ